MSDVSGILGLSAEARRETWSEVLSAIEHYQASVGEGQIGPASLDPRPLQRKLEAISFEEPLEPVEAIRFAVEGLSAYQVHTPHPRYFGLFNPAPTTMGIAADALVAAFNPQMAAWSHNPFAAETEQYLIRSFGARFGYRNRVAGTFASGGAEANLTAVICALVARFPEFSANGLRALAANPVFYVSEQAHHSFVKAARCCGLGTNAVRQVKVTPDLAMDMEALRRQIRSDRGQGLVPFLLVATAGTTSAGAFDDIATAVTISRQEDLWCHVDAAWGGAAALVPELRHHLNGIEDSDSITFDAHKFLSVPMGAGLFLTTRAAILREAFRITTDYMPAAVSEFETADPYTSSIQWSRRFIGLKLFLSLAVAGWSGYARVIRHQTRIGGYLLERLVAKGWQIVNHTPLPLVCFRPASTSQHDIERLLEKVMASRSVWISSVRIPELALRACITNYRTTESDVDMLIDALEAARAELR
jgi:glutamate/tyrosine decarboxylase-like PLP-dependent enzyme